MTATVLRGKEKGKSRKREMFWRLFSFGLRIMMQRFFPLLCTYDCKANRSWNMKIQPTCIKPAFEIIRMLAIYRFCFLQLFWCCCHFKFSSSSVFPRAKYRVSNLPPAKKRGERGELSIPTHFQPSSSGKHFFPFFSIALGTAPLTAPPFWNALPCCLIQSKGAGRLLSSPSLVLVALFSAERRGR